MIVWCNLDKREVLSEADCYYCSMKKIIDTCPFFMGIKDAPEKEYKEYQRKHLKYNERKNMKYIRKDEVLEIVEKGGFLSEILNDIRNLKTYKGTKKKNKITKKVLERVSENIRKKWNLCFCSENCAYLLINEKEQNEFEENMNWKPDHLCSKYKCRLIHGNYHPKLLREKDCDE
jgi:hypothetical protein